MGERTPVDSGTPSNELGCGGTVELRDGRTEEHETLTGPPVVEDWERDQWWVER